MIGWPRRIGDRGRQLEPGTGRVIMRGGGRRPIELSPDEARELASAATPDAARALRACSATAERERLVELMGQQHRARVGLDRGDVRRQEVS